ncbi:MAG TPA: chemotaxis response regulator protein-glutamate methylesterase [Candidatus Acidoferrales bacterium]|jgi:two-component system response regulator WspF|nr:chemotaxis response regulator protein-glutamate methylesterase [Candidatus Acidoferrales bacterium]
MRIAIVNDVPLAVEALRRVVSSVLGYDIAWIAEDGEQAVRRCAADVPDLILMDLMMPRMDGAEATRHIMQKTPCAILVVTATVGGHASKVFQAMGWGALDAVDTPALGMSGDPTGAAPLLAKIAMLSRLIGRHRASAKTFSVAAVPENSSGTVPLVAIGASTGGPGALAQIISALPRDLRATVALVQHVDEQFAPGLASWLAGQSGHDVAPILPNDKPTAGRVLLASTNDHLILTREVTYRYTPDPIEYPYRPSVDVFFQSIAQFWPGPIVGVLLTGMGADGAEGLLGLRRAGWHTIAQDQATSIVYGMPKAAAKLKAAIEILPVEQIASAIVNAVRGSHSRRVGQRSQT